MSMTWWELEYTTIPFMATKSGEILDKAFTEKGKNGKNKSPLFAHGSPDKESEYTRRVRRFSIKKSENIRIMGNLPPPFVVESSDKEYIQNHNAFAKERLLLARDPPVLRAEGPRLPTLSQFAHEANAMPPLNRQSAEPFETEEAKRIPQKYTSHFGSLRPDAPHPRSDSSQATDLWFKPLGGAEIRCRTTCDARNVEPPLLDD